MMIRFLKKITLLFLPLLVVSFAVCYFIDPHNVFHAESIRDTGLTEARNYIKMKYVLANPDRFDSFVMGSSRVGTIHTEKIPGERCYNLNSPEGVPNEELENIKTLVENGVVPKRIYLGVDSLSYTDDYKERHRGIGYLVPYEFAKNKPLEFYRLYLDPSYAIDSYLSTTVSHEKNNDFQHIFYEYGWTDDYHTSSEYNFENVSASIGEEDYLDETLEDIRQIVSVCEEFNIRLTVFTNPMHIVTYEESVKQNYLEFLLRLAEIIPYYNFSGYNDITTNNANYLDPSHYNAETGDLIIDCICNNKTDPQLYKQGFGALINSENAAEWIEVLNNNNNI